MTTLPSTDLCEPEISPAQEVLPNDLIAFLISAYLAAGLSAENAWRAAQADYDCGFSDLREVMR